MTPSSMIKELVGFDTTSRNSNLELIEFIQAHLKAQGVESQLTFDADRSKANLFATIGPQETAGGVVLSGHTDVVPVDGQDWSHDPFSVLEKDGRLYGRGTADMKGFIAIALALTPEFLAADLQIPIHFAFTYDEETTCAGAKNLVRDLAGQGVSPRAVIIGEPTSMRVVNAHKGGYNYTTRIVGQEAHSSLTHHGVNAIALASDLIAHLLDYANKLGRRADPDNGFDPPYSTLSIGTIQGGTASNIVAKECEFEWDWRPIPEDPFEGPRESLDAYAESLLPKLREIAPKASIQTVCDSGHVPLMPEEDSSAEKLVMALAETNQTFKVAYGTEGWVYQEQNMPVVVFGPGSIEQAHKPDEFIDLEQVDACTDFLRKLIARFSGNQET
jgi:acetylornithine deacetylase